MTKTELVERIVKDTDITKTAAGSVVNTIIASITQAIKKGNKVTLIGFGTLQNAQG